MAEISAAAVKALRDETGQPMMDCKAALVEAGGDKAKAIQILREKGSKVQATRLGRDTEFGRIGVFVDDKGGALVEILCESAPVANGPDCRQFAEDCAKALATNPAVKSADELLKLKSSSRPGTLLEQKDDLFNRLREVFNIGRFVKYAGTVVGYVHATGDLGSLVEFEGSDPVVAKDIAMHIVATSPLAVTKEELDPAEVEKERAFLTDQARKEGKPDNIIAKMIEGRMKNFYSARVLLEQPFVKDQEQTVDKLLKSKNTKIKRFVNWKLGKA
ncbi:MAG: translation elongation factor Ts [Planctomycetaceae bacterium]|nr:translation elongation factor Ts [Planctomycetaceae bacterium]